MSQVFLSLGSNLGNRKENLNLCLKKLIELFGETVKSSIIYETEAWGFEAKEFLNQVIVFSTELNPESILFEILRIEKEIGRKRSHIGYESRVIDIDILFYDSIIYRTNDLVIPHPLIQDRKFILQALNEICSDFVHPVLKKPISEIYLNCVDNCKIKKYNSQSL